MLHRFVLRASGPVFASFIAGVVVGIGFSGSDDASWGIERVAGKDGEKRAQRQEPLAKVTPSDVSGKAAEFPAEPRPSRTLKRSLQPKGMDISSQRLSAREVGDHSLEFTAFVRSGSYYGAGVLLDTDGHIATCNHVLDEGSEIEVSFADQGPFEAELLDTDPHLDLALLKIEGPGRQPAQPGAVSEIHMGDEVYGVGAPRKLRFSMSRGIVSYVGRPFDDIYYLQTDLPTNSGNSGGPILNDHGEVLAIASFIYRDSQGLAFALPIEYVYERFQSNLEEPAALQASFDRWKQSLSARAETDAPGR